MRIAHFSDCYVPRINGVTTSISVLKRAQEREGHEVVLVAPRYLQNNGSEPGLIRFSSFYQPFQPEDRGLLPWPPVTLAELGRQKVDIVHVHTPFNAGLMGWAKARLGRVPLVFTHHTLWEEYAHYLRPVPIGWARWVGEQIANFFFRSSQAVVLPSQEIADALVGRRIRVPHRVIPTGIDCDTFRHGDGQRVFAELGVPAHTRLFLYIGRMGKEKSIDLLLHAFRLYREKGGQGMFLLVGGGPELEALRQQSFALGLNESVRFLGYRPRHELRHYLAAARLFLFASQTETQGLVLLEAAAAGVPVLAVRAPGVNEAVDPERSGVLLPRPDATAFGEALLEVDAQEERRHSLAEGARQWAEGFSDREMARKMTELYSVLTRP